MLTQEQLDFLEGAMLGDGSLIIHKNGKNAYFSYLSSKKDHVEFVFDKFHELCNYAEVKCSTYTDKRTLKEYTRYYFRTRALPCLTEVYEKWYDSDGRKFIPRDVKLTPKVLLVWYIGDGHLNTRSKGAGFIKLATNCFTETDIAELLLPQLSDFEAKIYKSENQSIVIIPRRLAGAFLELLGPCPVESYDYKWHVAGYKYNGYQEGIEKLSDDCISQIIEQYQSGVSCYRIGKMLKIEHNRIKYHLKKVGVYVPGRDKLQSKFLPEQLDIISIMREDGVAWKTIGKTFDCDYRLIMYYMRKRNETG